MDKEKKYLGPEYGLKQVIGDRMSSSWCHVWLPPSYAMSVSPIVQLSAAVRLADFACLRQRVANSRVAIRVCGVAPRLLSA
jgi:hypothetical protein